MGDVCPYGFSSSKEIFPWFQEHLVVGNKEELLNSHNLGEGGTSSSFQKNRES